MTTHQHGNKHISSLMDMSRYQQPTDDARDPSNYAKYVRLTSELIGRSYIATAKLVENWPEHKIERRYKEAINCSELTKPYIRWWSLRKRDKEQKENEAA